MLHPVKAAPGRWCPVAIAYCFDRLYIPVWSGTPYEFVLATPSVCSAENCSRARMSTVQCGRYPRLSGGGAEVSAVNCVYDGFRLSGLFRGDLPRSHVRNHANGTHCRFDAPGDAVFDPGRSTV